VSTDDSEVKAHLRQLGEPICKYIKGLSRYGPEKQICLFWDINVKFFSWISNYFSNSV